MQYFAHSANKAGSPWEPLQEHLRCVAKRAAEYTGSFGAEDEAKVAGLWHDLGKYSELFTLRLKGQVGGLDHWSPGALATLAHFREKGLAAAWQSRVTILGCKKDQEKAFEPPVTLIHYPTKADILGVDVDGN